MNIDPVHCTGCCDCGGPLTWTENGIFRVAVCCVCFRPYIWNLTQPPPDPWPFRLGELVPRDEPERKFPDFAGYLKHMKSPEYCPLTTDEWATSERLLRLALEG